MDQKKLILAGIIAFAVLYLDVSLLLNWQINTLKGMNPKIEQGRKEIDDLKRYIANAKIAPPKQADKAVKPKKFVSEGGIPSLLNTISDIANKNKVSILQIKPLSEPQAKDDKAQASSNLSAVSISLEASASYHNLGLFINQLENSDVFIVVEVLKISVTPGDYFQQKASIRLKTYVKK